MDTFCLPRRRTYLTSQSADQLPAVSEPGGSTGVRGYRETAQLALHGEGDAEPLQDLLASAAREIPGLVRASFGRNLAPEYAAGHYTWDIVFSDYSAAEAARASDYWREQVAATA